MTGDHQYRHLDKTGDDRSDCGSGNFKSWETEKAKDQDGI